MRQVRSGIVSALVACCLFIFGALQFAPRTALGTQCPTAPTQAVAVPVTNCCGKIVCYRQRKPVPGERAFVQCRCAEKKAANQTPVPKSPVLIPMDDPVQVRTAAIPLALEKHEYLAAWQSSQGGEQFHPPTCI